MKVFNKIEGRKRLQTHYKWKNGTIVRISFLDGPRSYGWTHGQVTFKKNLSTTTRLTTAEVYNYNMRFRLFERLAVVSSVVVDHFFLIKNSFLV